MINIFLIIDVAYKSYVMNTLNIKVDFLNSKKHF